MCFQIRIPLFNFTAAFQFTSVLGNDQGAVLTSHSE